VELAEVTFVTALGMEYILEGDFITKVAKGLDRGGLGQALVCVFPDLSDEHERKNWSDNGFNQISTHSGYYYHEGAAEIAP
jgi:hypothetical protein